MTNPNKTFYITTPIYYVNDEPHIGHFYTTLACDILARYKRLDGYNVIFTTGTDEHGIKIENKAKSIGITTVELVDKLSETFATLFKKTNFSHDKFIRTTSENHKEVVQSVWNELYNKSLIYKGDYEGFYSVSDESFYTKSEIIHDTAKDCLVAISSGSEVQPIQEESYFFKLSEFEKPLLNYYEKHPEFVAPKEKFNEVKSFVKSGLKDLSISRVRVKWGISAPNIENHTIYVWLDALSSYLTGINYLNDKEGEFNTFWPADVHMVGKDILKFHAIYWPAFLMALDLPLPKKIFAHGWWTNNKQKMSKSLGNAIKPYELIDSYGLDEIRYFLMREMPFGADGDFNKISVTNRINHELVNEYGNLCQRSFSLVYNSLGGKVVSTKNKPEFYDDIQSLFATTRQLIDKQAFHLYLENVWLVIKRLNSYMHEKAPWALIKDEKLQEAQEVLYSIVDAIKDISILLLPFIPNIASKALIQINYPLDKHNFKHISDTHTTYEINERPVPIVRKLVED